MSLMKRWNEYLGPKDERLEAESARYLRTGYYLLLAGVVMCVYYGVMLEQVACVADVPLLTAAGAGVVSPNVLLMGALLVACFIPLALQARRGIVSDRARFAQVDSVPWDLVLLTSLACGAAVAVLSVVMRVLAEVQIVGVASVAATSPSASSTSGWPSCWPWRSRPPCSATPSRTAVASKTSSTTSPAQSARRHLAG